MTYYKRYNGSQDFSGIEGVRAILEGNVFEKSNDSNNFSLYGFNPKGSVSYAKNEILSFGKGCNIGSKIIGMFSFDWELINLNGVSLLCINEGKFIGGEKVHVNYLFHDWHDDELTLYCLDKCQEKVVTLRKISKVSPDNNIKTKLSLVGEWGNQNGSILLNNDTTTFVLSPFTNLAKSTGIWGISSDGNYVILSDTMALQIDPSGNILNDFFTGKKYYKKN